MGKLTGKAAPKSLKLYVCEFFPNRWARDRVSYPMRPEEWYKSKSNICGIKLYKVYASSDNEAWELILEKIREYGHRNPNPMGRTWMPYCRNGRDGSKLDPPMDTSYWGERK